MTADRHHSTNRRPADPHATEIPQAGAGSEARERPPVAGDEQDGDTVVPGDGFATEIDPLSTTIPDHIAAAQRPSEAIDSGVQAVRSRSLESRESGWGDSGLLASGDRYGDFRILRVLGQGSFGAVYLAREISLDRLVALKVVKPEGQRGGVGEGRSLARLKHPGIVGVFGEMTDSDSGSLLLWMQYVDGCTLAALIERLQNVARRCPSGSWNEADLMVQLSAGEETELRRSPRSSVDMVCQLGWELAEALWHAHQCGITHRDIKPANILMQRSGAPLLADFNLAENPHNTDVETIGGGTVAYMPPEQLAQTLREPVDVNGRRADVYSLGVVLWELATGQRPMATEESQLTSSGASRLFDFLRLRRQGTAPSSPHVPTGLAMVLGKTLQVEPQDRFRSARALATALRGLVDLQAARHSISSSDSIQWVRRNLFWILLIGGLLPNFGASILQSAYNAIYVGNTPQFETAFPKAFLAYNLVVYPACVGWLAWNLYQFARTYREVVARVPLSTRRTRDLRRRLMRLPRQFMIASAVGWFPGAILFPLLLTLFGDTLSRNDWYHYGISFTIAGMIATTYSYAIVLYIVVVYGYRVCWQTAACYVKRSRLELSGIESRIGRLSILVGTLPLAAAVLLLAIGMPELAIAPTEIGDVALSSVALSSDAVSSDAVPSDAVSSVQSASQNVSPAEETVVEAFDAIRSLHGLVIALIVLGGIGLYVVTVASEKMVRIVRALTLTG